MDLRVFSVKGRFVVWCGGFGTVWSHRDLNFEREAGGGRIVMVVCD